MFMVLNMPEYAMGSEYALVYINMSNCARILSMPESAEIYPNMGKYTSICLTLRIWLNVPET